MTVSQEITPLIIMDERERGDIRKVFAEFPCHLQIETLPTADYLIAADIGIERKRGDDLVASICDNRFFAQISKMKTHYPHSLLLLENPHKMFTRSGVASASIYGAILYALYKIQIPMITTLTAFETAQTIWSFAKNYQKDHPFIYQPLTLPPAEIDQGLQTTFIEGLIGVSEVKARLLLQEFHTPWNIIRALHKSELRTTPSGKIKIQESAFANLKGFGPKFVAQNRNLVTLPFHQTVGMKKAEWSNYSH